VKLTDRLFMRETRMISDAVRALATAMEVKKDGHLVVKRLRVEIGFLRERSRQMSSRM
jgi:hypothetical protein